MPQEEDRPEASKTENTKETRKLGDDALGLGPSPTGSAAIGVVDSIVGERDSEVPGELQHSTTRMATMRDMVGRLDPAMEGCDDDPAYRTAVVLLAAACIGPAVDGLVACTGYEKEFITKIAERMHLAGLWSKTSVRYQHWLADDGDTIQPCSFWADVLVAEGLVTAQPEGPTSVRYWRIEPVH